MNCRKGFKKCDDCAWQFLVGTLFFWEPPFGSLCICMVVVGIIVRVRSFCGPRSFVLGDHPNFGQ